MSCRLDKVTKSGRRQNGFTLIELLVVIAIISVLVALLLPAVQGVRESARQLQCRNNLFHIGLALANYRHVHEVFPPGVVNQTSPVQNEPKGFHLSWTVQLLPFLDQQNLFNHIDFQKGAYSLKNKQALVAIPSVFKCPSNRNAFLRRKVKFGKAVVEVVPSSYAACYHNQEAPIDERGNGTLFLNSSVTRKDISDGLGNTLFVGEKFIPPRLVANEIEQLDLGWLSGTRATLRNTGHKLNESKRRFWAAKRASNGAAEPTELKPEKQTVGGFGSEHPQGVLFLFGDGCVKFLNQFMDMNVLQCLANRSDGELVPPL